MQLIKKAVFGKTMKNVRKHRDVKLVTIERRRNHLVSKSNYDTTSFFTKKFVSYTNEYLYRTFNTRIK